jgi:hypothetical protein
VRSSGKPDLYGPPGGSCGMLLVDRSRTASGQGYSTLSSSFASCLLKESVFLQVWRLYLIAAYSVFEM